MKVLLELRTCPHGWEVLLAYEKEIGYLIHHACRANHDSDAIVLAKAAKLARS